MKHLAHLNKYFYKYRWRMIPGVIFVMASNYFGVLPAQVIRIAFDLVKENISMYRLFEGFDRQQLVYEVFGYCLLLFGALVLVLALDLHVVEGLGRRRHAVGALEPAREALLRGLLRLSV